VYKREELRHYDIGTKWHSVKTRVTCGFKEHVKDLLALVSSANHSSAV
jgi:hypothetical protein